MTSFFPHPSTGKMARKLGVSKDEINEMFSEFDTVCLLRTVFVHHPFCSEFCLHRTDLVPLTPKNSEPSPHR